MPQIEYNCMYLQAPIPDIRKDVNQRTNMNQIGQIWIKATLNKDMDNKYPQINKNIKKYPTRDIQNLSPIPNSHNIGKCGLFVLFNFGLLTF